MIFTSSSVKPIQLIDQLINLLIHRAKILHQFLDFISGFFLGVGHGLSQMNDLILQQKDRLLFGRKRIGSHAAIISPTDYRSLITAPEPPLLDSLKQRVDSQF